MEKNLVGFRFYPTEEELINHYLKNKNQGQFWLVDDAINEINIRSYEPMFLPSLSKIQSNDLVWYFFSLIEHTSGNKKGTKRSTVSGFWKVTGVDREIKVKNVVIGIKKTLVYHKGRHPNGVRTPWVTHEYHITYLPPDQRNYVICKVMYNGEDMDILYGGNSNLCVPQPSHSFVPDSNTANTMSMNVQEDLSPSNGFNPDDFLNDNDNNNDNNLDVLLNPMNVQKDLSPTYGNPDTLVSEYMNNNNLNVQPQTPYDYEYCSGVLDYDEMMGIEYLLSSPEFRMQENRNNHMAKKPITRVITAGYSSNSDAESISATSYQGTSSPDGSPNKHFPSCSNTESFKDPQTSEEPSINRKNRESQLTRRTISSKQEVKEGKSKAVSASKESSMAKKGLFITEEAIQRKGKNPRYIYLMNMIICFIVLVTFLKFY
ncbi:hypothetical protein AALP_AA6G015500 [Arabis alpina]|uniref:NAC domain-containing protein n=1 Tax=Arabis alpina TaxID=50452 RepID=A0A087GLE3_ARAAL|nr:hypothetical protein AALP_AA6G015500 [Arabis alpina]